MGPLRIGCNDSMDFVLALHEPVPRAMDHQTPALFTRGEISHISPGNQHLTDTQRCRNRGPVRLLVSLLEFNQEEKHHEQTN